jgi:high-affinity iron transporter
MRLKERTAWIATIVLSGIWQVGFASRTSQGAEISGVVRMPDICSPAISPAVVYLRLADGKERHALSASASARASSSGANPAEVVLVNQHDLQFLPRVQVLKLGQTIRFTNQDGETHNVHVVSPGFAFNQAMGPGQFQDFTPERPGVMRLACDIHLHMRGFVVVSPTPWARVCGRDGRFRLDGVPDGRYVLTAWHEMGEPLRTNVTVAGGKSLKLPPLVLTVPEAQTRFSAGEGPPQNTAPVRPWHDVLDRISMTLAACRDAATRSGELARARRLADDAYFAEFEASDMETAVRKYLGFTKAGGLERQFLAIRSAACEVSDKRRPPAELADLCRKLLLDLVSVTRELDAKGVTNRSQIDAVGGIAAALPEQSAATEPGGDPKRLLLALKRGFHRIDQEAESNGPDEAASELTSVYMTEFEPLERYLFGRSPQDVRPLEIQFNTLRGDLAAGLKGEKLSARLSALGTEVETLIDRLETRPTGTFAPAFFASLITILREGLEVILVLTMLIALVAKASTTLSKTNTGDDSEGVPAVPATDIAATARARALRAIGWGVALAVGASLATALALNVLVASVQGEAREILEGLVMLAASGVLFYVSYWLISQLEAKRWMDFLKQQARRGLELSGQGTLALTAFLAVYREGAETSLMYQALLGSEGRTRPGFLGLAAGLALGLVLLALIAVLIRATTVRLPLRTFFKLSGLFLFALAIVFAGNGVFELQNAGVLLTTNLAWLGRGLPWAGLYPNLQVISVQGLLLAGAILGWLLIPRTSLRTGAPGAA